LPKRLTAAAVAKLRAGPKRRSIPDGRGLYLLIQPTGAKSWAMVFRNSGGRMTKLTLGRYDPAETSAEPVVGGPLSLAAARRLAAEVSRQRAAGQDVSTVTFRAKRNTDTFDGAARDFVREHAQPKTRRWREQARLLGLDPDDDLKEIPGGLASRWRARAVTEVSPDDIFGAVDDARRRGLPGLTKKKDGILDSRGRHLLSTLSRTAEPVHRRPQVAAA
jgi:Arm DNA-binding domain